MKYAQFNRFCLELPEECVNDCTLRGANDTMVAHWAPLLERPAEATIEAVRAEVAETGGWEAHELEDNAANWRRVVWIACWNIREEA